MQTTQVVAPLSSHEPQKLLKTITWSADRSQGARISHS
jgi:hypothetical protein